MQLLYAEYLLDDNLANTWGHVNSKLDNLIFPVVNYFHWQIVSMTTSFDKLPQSNQKCEIKGHLLNKS